jgi:hypothetical protein
VTMNEQFVRIKRSRSNSEPPKGVRKHVASQKYYLPKPNSQPSHLNSKSSSIHVYQKTPNATHSPTVAHIIK